MTSELKERVVRDHQRLHARLAACLDRLIALDFAAAREAFAGVERHLRRHVMAEDRHLLPLLDACSSPRWGGHVYRAEHDKLLALARAFAQALEAACEDEPPDAASARRRALALIDAAHPLRHVLEHHEQREEQGILLELSIDRVTLQRLIEDLADDGSD